MPTSPEKPRKENTEEPDEQAEERKRCKDQLAANLGDLQSDATAYRRRNQVLEPNKDQIRKAATK